MPRPIVAAVVVGQPVELDAVDQYPAGVDLVEAGEAVEQRRLAAAAGAHYGDDLAPLHAQVYAPEGVHLDGACVVGLVYVRCFDDRVCQFLTIPRGILA